MHTFIKQHQMAPAKVRDALKLGR